MSREGREVGEDPETTKGLVGRGARPLTTDDSLEQLDAMILRVLRETHSQMESQQHLVAAALPVACSTARLVP
jgi:hypothetical protein